MNQPGPGFESGDWRLLGKVAITTENESRILGIDWRQSGDRSVIDLSGPLGISVAQVEVLGDRLTITTSKGVSHQSNDLSMVLNQDVPISLPWRELRSWVRGMTVGGELIGPDGHDSGAWQVRVVKKDESGPRLILFNHRLATLRLHIRDWR